MLHKGHSQGTTHNRNGRGAILLFVLLPFAALSAQTTQAKAPIYVRMVRIDSILLAFGVDSARVRTAAVNAIRDAGRLAEDTTGAALDIDVTVPRPLHGGMFDPRGYVHMEVGRNLVERGVARTVLWQGMVDLPQLATWREFSRATLSEVVRAVNEYLLSGIRGYVTRERASRPGVFAITPADLNLNQRPVEDR